MHVGAFMFIFCRKCTVGKARLLLQSWVVRVRVPCLDPRYTKVHGNGLGQTGGEKYKVPCRLAMSVSLWRREKGWI